MIGNILAALVGGAIDRKDGDSGLEGAAAGAVAYSVAKRVVPLVLLAGGVMMIARAAGRRDRSA